MRGSGAVWEAGRKEEEDRKLAMGWGGRLGDQETGHDMES